MPKPHTFPALYNEVMQINISTLTIHNYLEPNQRKSGTLSWSRYGKPTGNISFQVNTMNEQLPYIQLDYKYNDEPKSYKIYLTSTPSNLNRGEIWYFICPKRKKRCRILYLLGGYFSHREAISGCLYEKQTQSKKNRLLHKKFEDYYVKDQLYNELHKRNFKKTYAGKPTKKYLRLMERIERAERITHYEIMEALLS